MNEAKSDGSDKEHDALLDAFKVAMSGLRAERGAPAADGPREPDRDPFVPPTAHADGLRAAASPPSSAAPQPDQGPRLRHAARMETCVLIGPSNAGKTCTLVALNAACYVDPRGGDYTMSVLGDPTVDPDNRLARLAVEWVGRDDPPTVTEVAHTYKVEISTRIDARLFRPAQLVVTALRCSDGPGGTLFPSRKDLDGVQRVSPEAIERALADARHATTIMLLLDAAAPAVDLVEMHLPRLLDRIAESLPGDELPKQGAAGLLQRLGLGRGRPRARHMRLRASRFLLLLTKIDELAFVASRELARRSITASPLAVANAIDPLALALDRVGERTLRRIRRAIGVNADLAVGLASATGFCRRDGASFLEWGRGRSSDERLRTWTPYGIHEALLFITTGRCVGPIQRIDSETELQLDRAFAVDTYPFEGTT